MLFVLALIISCENEKSDIIQETDIAPDKVITSMVQYPFNWDEIEKNNVKVIGGDGPGSTIAMAFALAEIDLDRDNNKEIKAGERD